jgi:translation initiation factor 2B subunit (eIF-2B alpha/beta/delta family)
MALHTRKEFAALCHTTTAIVTTNINRDKVILFDKKIDSENPVNVSFFNKYHKKYEDKLKKANKNEVLYNEVVEKVQTKVVSKKKKKKAEKERQAAIEEGGLFNDWDLRKKIAEALLKERNAEKALLSVKKMYGEMLPTEFVLRMFSTFTKTVLSTFYNSNMNLAGVYCDELAGGDRDSLSKINQRLDEEIQLIIDAAAEIAKKDMENEIKEYSVTRGKGENK